jgi:hypothetical protein
MTTTDQKASWHGSYLDEDGLVADVLSKVKADAEAAKRWLDPASWRLPTGLLGERPGIVFGGSKKIVDEDPQHAGCLMFAGMSIRNFYGLWHADNPHTVADGDDLKVEDGVITDDRHPDNLSGRVIDRVKKALASVTS